jgi:hypothetical protein
VQAFQVRENFRELAALILKLCEHEAKICLSFAQTSVVFSAISQESEQKINHSKFSSDSNNALIVVEEHIECTWIFLRFGAIRFIFLAVSTEVSSNEAHNFSKFSKTPNCK